MTYRLITQAEESNGNIIIFAKWKFPDKIEKVMSTLNQKDQTLIKKGATLCCSQGVQMNPLTRNFYFYFYFLYIIFLLKIVLNP